MLIQMLSALFVLFAAWRVPVAGRLVYYRKCSEPERPLTLRFSLEGTLVLLITDGTYRYVELGDGTYISVHETPGTQPLRDGQIDATVLWPRESRDFTLVQLTLVGLFHRTLATQRPYNWFDVGYMLNQHLGVAREDAERLVFKAALFFGGADYIRYELFQQRRTGVSVTTLVRELDELIVPMLRAVPGKPPGAHLGVGFYTCPDGPSAPRIRVDEELRADLNSSVRDDSRYYDRVLMAVTEVLRDRGRAGAVVSNTGSQFCTRAPFIWLGNLGQGRSSNGYGLPRATDVVNAARLLISGINLALLKLGVLPSNTVPNDVRAPARVGFVDFSRSAADLGSVPRWSPEFGHFAGRPVALTAYRPTPHIAAHVWSIGDARVVRFCYWLLYFWDF